jgi:hypothetical protein
MPEIEGLDLEFEHESTVESALKQALTARSATQSSYDMSSPVDILSSGAKRSLVSTVPSILWLNTLIVVGKGGTTAYRRSVNGSPQLSAGTTAVRIFRALVRSFSILQRDLKLRANKPNGNTAITTIQDIHDADQMRSLVKKAKPDQDARTLLHTDSAKVTELQNRLWNKNDAEGELFQ